MRGQNRSIWVPTLITLLVASSGCVTRGYVRNEVGESSDLLLAGIRANSEQLERTRQDLAGLEAEALESDRAQNEKIATTAGMIETTRNEMSAEVEEVRTIALTTQNLAGDADERSRNLTRMFADRGRLGVTDTQEIYFAFSSSAIAPEHAEALQSAGDSLHSEPNTILVLEGRTDSTGDPAFNRELGQSRVDAAMNYLVLELGVPVHRIYGFSYGETRPAYDNETLEDRQKNRSVKLVILGPETGTTLAALPE